MERNNLFFYYLNPTGIEEKIATIHHAAIENGFKVVEDAKHANIIVSIGGDGAFLQAARKTKYRQDCIYIGINRSGEASLYCDFYLDNVDEMMHTMQHEELEVRRFPIIKVNINNETSFFCLNELSVRSTIIKSIVMDVFIDEQHFETFRGDGLIVATPTGSTGYNKSTNGAVIDPRIPCFQVTELASINNNRYRTLGSSFILNKDRTLRLSVRQDGNDYPIIGLDNEAYSIKNIQDITVTLSDKVVKTVKLKNNSFWDRVKRTFL